MNSLSISWENANRTLLKIGDTGASWHIASIFYQGDVHVLLSLPSYPSLHFHYLLLFQCSKQSHRRIPRSSHLLLFCVGLSELKGMVNGIPIKSDMEPDGINRCWNCLWCTSYVWPFCGALCSVCYCSRALL